MRITEIRTLYDYNYWANARVIRAAGQVQPEQLTRRADVSHGSLLGSLVHVLSAEWVWRLRCQEGISPPALLREEDFPTLADLQRAWAAEEQAMRAYLRGLSDAALDEKIHYSATSGTPHTSTLWHVLVHVVNHGTQFRAEAAVLLTAFGRSPGNLDFIAFLRKQH
ncbi:MAG: hypothetical protein Kow00124_15830 [Anaerolineae bacterium]